MSLFRAVVLGAPLVLLMLRTANANCGKPAYIEGFLTGGQDVSDVRKWPWMVSLRTKKTGHYCGGVLIAREWVLTTAHCVKDKAKESLEIWLGSLDHSISEPSRQKRKARSIIIRGDYIKKTNPFYVANDIALIRLNEPADLKSTVLPVCLPSASQTFQNCHVVGWGATSKGGAVSDVQREIKATILPDNGCASLGTPYKELVETGNTFCVYAPGGGQVCMGDAGGPILCQDDYKKLWHVVGVSSWAPSWCVQKTVIFGYTDVIPYLSWIKNKCNC